ncbi:MAG: hypothetical protein DWB42_10705 [Chloroflexi bacterium]|nr:hypothetical protein [Chloroflexota bacterium]MDL1883001.1 hypothetical protein [Anaerolineae bacterium CFX8]
MSRSIHTFLRPVQHNRIGWLYAGLLLGLCAFALWPLLYRPGLPNGNDVLYHVFRAAEMSRSWDNGVLLPRWAEAFYTGYGAPVFHYYAGLSYYATSLLMRLFSLDALNALRALIVLSVFGGGAGMYAFVRPLAGRPGGVIAALAYIYSPYLLFTEPYSRGAYPEMAAFALFPWVMAAYGCLARTGSAGAFVAAAAGSAALIFTHNLMALVLTGLLVGWLVWSLPAHMLAHGRAGLLPRLLALVAAASGVGLAAVFWLPVMLESDAVRLGNLTAVAQLDYRNFFVPVERLLAFSPRYDEGALNGLVHRFNLGAAQWALAAGGCIFTLWVLARRRSAGRKGDSAALYTLYFALAGLVCIVLMLPAAEGLWSAVSPLAFLQFPWRFLGPAAFCLAALAGMNARWIERLPGWAAGATSAGIVAAIIGLALPALYAPEWIHETVDSSVAAYHREELAGRQRATTFSNEYLPKAVIVEPGPTPRLLADYADGYPVNKAHLEALPNGVTVELLEHSPQHDAWRVTAAAPFTLEVLTFDFAGWQASVDNQPVVITPSEPHGLITLPVPAGEHIVRVWLGSTPARDLGGAISLGALLEVMALAALLRRKTDPPAPPVDETAAPRPPAGLAAGGLIALALAVVFLREGGAWLNSPPGEVLPAQHQTGFRLGESLQLLGYDLNGETFRPGDRLELRLYWYTTAAIPYGYSSFVHVSSGGPPLAQADKLNPADRPTKEWTSGGYIQDDYTIGLPPDIPPGIYSLLVGLYTCDMRPPGECGNGDRLPVMDAAGSPLGDAALLATLEVR